MSMERHAELCTGKRPTRGFLAKCRARLVETNSRGNNVKMSDSLVELLSKMTVEPRILEIINCDSTIIAFGNRLCSEHTSSDVETVKIRRNLEVMAAITAMMFDKDEDPLKELSVAFYYDERKFDLFKKAVLVCIGYEEGKCRAPTQATFIGRAWKECGELLREVYVERDAADEKIKLDGWMKIYSARYYVEIEKPARVYCHELSPDQNGCSNEETDDSSYSKVQTDLNGHQEQSPVPSVSGGEPPKRGKRDLVARRARLLRMIQSPTQMSDRLIELVTKLNAAPRIREFIVNDLSIVEFGNKLCNENKMEYVIRRNLKVMAVISTLMYDMDKSPKKELSVAFYFDRAKFELFKKAVLAHIGYQNGAYRAPTQAAAIGRVWKNCGRVLREVYEDRQAVEEKKKLDGWMKKYSTRYYIDVEKPATSYYRKMCWDGSSEGEAESRQYYKQEMDRQLRSPPALRSSNSWLLPPPELNGFTNILPGPSSSNVNMAVSSATNSDTTESDSDPCLDPTPILRTTTSRSPWTLTQIQVLEDNFAEYLDKKESPPGHLIAQVMADNSDILQGRTVLTIRTYINNINLGKTKRRKFD